METGSRLNIIQDKIFEGPMFELITKTINHIRSQMREFSSLDTSTNTFTKMPEYPEAAWVEGIVNAVIHRDYSLVGTSITIAMYEDRLEIKSPGTLPNIVNLTNMKETRYSRNPKIARRMQFPAKI